MHSHLFLPGCPSSIDATIGPPHHTRRTRSTSSLLPHSSFVSIYFLPPFPPPIISRTPTSESTTNKYPLAHSTRSHRFGISPSSSFLIPATLDPHPCHFIAALTFTPDKSSSLFHLHLKTLVHKRSTHKRPVEASATMAPAGIFSALLPRQNLNNNDDYN